MANEFVARKGLIVLSNGAIITGSSAVNGNLNLVGNEIITGSLTVSSSGVAVTVVGNQLISGTLNVLQPFTGSIVSASQITGSFNGSFVGAGTLSGGTVNYIPLWSSSIALSSSVLYQNAGRIGIGTLSPTATLDVNGTIRAATSMSVNTISINTGATGTSQNTVVGQESLFNNTTGGNNTSVGYYTLRKVTTAGYNTAVGSNTLSELVSGTENTAVGAESMYFLGVGSNNSALGAGALRYNQSGSNNTAIGYNALFGDLFTPNVNDNTVVGYEAGKSISNANRNTFIGYRAGISAVNTHYSVIIGSYNGLSPLVNLTSTSGSIVLSDGFGNPRMYYHGTNHAWVLQTSGSERLRIVSGGNVGIGTSAPAATLHVQGNVSASSFTGSFSGTIAGNAQTATSASYAANADLLDGLNSTQFAVTSSNIFNGNQTVTGSISATGDISASNLNLTGNGIVAGNFTVNGLLTAASQSVLYITSSQLDVSTNKITVSTNNVLRFGGLSVIDSGSANHTGSLYWDSLTNRWIYENVSGSPYNSAILIAGPQNYGSLGDEVGLVGGRIPIAISGDHIDSRPESSSIRVDFPSRLTHVEAGLVVTGSVRATSAISASIVSASQITGSFFGTISGTVEGTAANSELLDGLDSTVFAKTGSNVFIGNQTITGSVATTGQLTVQGVLFTTASNLTVNGPGTIVIASLSTGSYDAAHFDYVIKKGANVRTGTVMTAWQAGTSTIEHTDTSTADLGSTSEVSLNTDILSGNVRLRATLTTTGWTIKSFARFI